VDESGFGQLMDVWLVGTLTFASAKVRRTQIHFMTSAVGGKSHRSKGHRDVGKASQTPFTSAFDWR
jgi:hypothetical protein